MNEIWIAVLIVTAIGLIAGVYSSNCIAPTLWTLWQGAVDRKKAAKNN